MNLFRKNYNDKSVDGDYLKSADTVGRPAAAVYIIIIILLISAVVFSLFISGRWVYKSVTANNKNNTTQKAPTNKPVDNSTTNSANSNTNNTNSTTQTTNTSTTQNQPKAPTKIPNTGPEDE